VTQAEFTAARDALGLNNPALALLLGVHRSIAYRWESGHTPIPRYVEIILTELQLSAGFRKRLGIGSSSSP
jgi:DNA-binding transcriptional regulator YiaG